MSKLYTHVIEKLPEEANPQTRQMVPSRSILSRANGGMVIGARIGQQVSLGEDRETAITRTYRDEKYAEAALREFADEDRRRDIGTDYTAGAIIEEIEIKNMIQSPSLADVTSISGRRR